ncbi:Laminin subunit beta-4 [Linum perenne]
MLQHEAAATEKEELLETEIGRLENELKEKGIENVGSLATINELQNHIKSLEEEIKTQEQSIQQHEAATANTKEELKAEIERLENELKEEQNEYSCSLATIKELQNHIKSLEEELKQQEQGTKRLQNEFKKQQKQNSTSLATIKELETHISSLEDELEQQAQTFEADLATITRERVDQEQRAIRAEEALKLTRWKNSNTAEKLQEEFKRLSKQMASTFEANESVAMKAMEEANEVRIQKIQLEDMVRRAKSELQSVKDDYEEKLVELSNQLNLKTQQVEKLLGGTSNKKVQKLQDEIEKLVKENNFFSTQVEEMKGSIKNYEELVKSIAVLKKEAEKSAEDLRKMRSIQDAEVERLQCQCDDLKHSLIEDEMEKEKLRMQLVCLKGDLKKKDEALISSEKKLKDCKNRALIASRTNKSAALAANGTKEVSNLKEKIRLLEMQIRSKETALETSASSFMNKERDLMDKIEELEESVDELNRKTKPKSFNIDDKEFSADELVKELISLKERNEEMGSELLDMQERYSEISLKFAEVEGERQKLVMTVRSLKNNARKEIKQ